VNRARRVEAPIASVASVVVVGPSVDVPAGSGTTLWFSLPRMPLSVSWVVAAVGHHCPTHKNHWRYCVSVRPSKNLSFLLTCIPKLAHKLTSRTCMMKTRLW
jgi:hypothetical protein